ncbi:MAG: TetR/AcrR family transcriptional regulator [Variovorax sp.]|nr:MAG: TetR/AcrR family transcriptional regulator [Variovorax sp.]
MPMREQLRNFKKERIMQEAGRLFHARGFGGTSLEAIADSMGMTKPFVYGVYDRKSDILFDISLRVSTLSLEAVEAASQAAGSPRDRLVRMAEGLAAVCMEHRVSVAVFFREEGLLDPEHLVVIHEVKGRIDEVFARLLEDGVGSGDFEIDDLRVAALAIGGMISWSYSWYRPGGRLSAQEIRAHMTGYALRIAGARE